MKNTTEDLNNHLMAQIERLTDEDLEGEALQKEVMRGEAVCRVAKTMIDNNRLVLDAAVAISESAQVPKHISIPQPEPNSARRRLSIYGD